MSSISPLREVLRSSDDDRLHNSGSRPMEQYRTPALGVRFTLNISSVLSARSTGSSQIAARAWYLAAQLGSNVETETSPDPVRALRALSGAVAERGLIAGVVLTATSSTPHAAPPAAMPARLAALALVTLASCSPPLVLWGREPSLALLQRDRALAVAWLRRSHAAPDARRAWSELEAFCTRGTP